MLWRNKKKLDFSSLIFDSRNILAAPLKKSVLTNHIHWFPIRALFTTTPGTGAINLNITFVEERLGLTHERPSYRATGTRPFPRSVLVWNTSNRLTSLSSTSRPGLCTHWSLTGNTAPPHSDVTRGRRWLVQRPLCITTVTGKGLMLCVTAKDFPKQELVSPVTTKMTAPLVTPESGLVQEEIMMTTTRVETKQNTHQIMGKNTSKPWVTFWCSDNVINT